MRKGCLARAFHEGLTLAGKGAALGLVGVAIEARPLNPKPFEQESRDARRP